MVAGRGSRALQELAKRNIVAVGYGQVEIYRSCGPQSMLGCRTVRHATKKLQEFVPAHNKYYITYYDTG